ncbi:MAG: hypothetical protein V2J08_11090 [Desulfotignum sp.]|jgi:hypothetical protein|nr:hypothetical protein [Desulfotignum sp.]
MNRWPVSTHLFILLFVFLASAVLAGGDEAQFVRYEMGFKNFVTCELTRIGPTSYFKGKSVDITMIDVYEARTESGLVIITGAVQCFVEDTYKTLYGAVGVKTIMDREKVVYFTIRSKDFSILATELMRHPYKERCGWSRYRVDIN